MPGSRWLAAITGAIELSHELVGPARERRHVLDAIGGSILRRRELQLRRLPAQLASSRRRIGNGQVIGLAVSPQTGPRPVCTSVSGEQAGDGVVVSTRGCTAQSNAANAPSTATAIAQEPRSQASLRTSPYETTLTLIPNSRYPTSGQTKHPLSSARSERRSLRGPRLGVLRCVASMPPGSLTACRMPRVLGTKRRRWARDGTRSVDRAAWHDPFAALASDVSDPIEVSVVVKNDQALGLGGGRDQELGDLAATLVLGGQGVAVRAWRGEHLQHSSRRGRRVPTLPQAGPIRRRGVPSTRPRGR